MSNIVKEFKHESLSKIKPIIYRQCFQRLHCFGGIIYIVIKDFTCSFLQFEYLAFIGLGRTSPNNATKVNMRLDV